MTGSANIDDKRTGSLLRRPWARALGEFGATIMFAGNLTGKTQTMPLAIMSAMESSLDTALVLSVLLILGSLAVLGTLGILARRNWQGEA